MHMSGGKHVDVCDVMWFVLSFLWCAACKLQTELCLFLSLQIMLCPGSVVYRTCEVGQIAIRLVQTL